jgi:hypothetical protein
VVIGRQRVGDGGVHGELLSEWRSKDAQLVA